MDEQSVQAKTIKVINSCKNRRQLWIADRYAKLACDMFPDIFVYVKEAIVRVACNQSRVERGMKPLPLFHG